MKREFRLQARARSLVNVKKADGEEYDPMLIAAQYKDTGLVCDKRSGAVRLLEDARNNKLPDFPAKKFKFRVKPIEVEDEAELQPASR